VNSRLDPMSVVVEDGDDYEAEEETPSMDPKAVFQNLKSEPDAEAMAQESRALLDRSEESDSDALAAIVSKLEAKTKPGKKDKAGAEEDDDEDNDGEEAEDRGGQPKVTVPSTKTTPRKIHAPKTTEPEPSARDEADDEEEDVDLPDDMFKAKGRASADSDGAEDIAMDKKVVFDRD